MQLHACRTACRDTRAAADVVGVEVDQDIQLGGVHPQGNRRVAVAVHVRPVLERGTAAPPVVVVGRRAEVEGECFDAIAVVRLEQPDGQHGRGMFPEMGTLVAHPQPAGTASSSPGQAQHRPADRVGRQGSKDAQGPALGRTQQAVTRHPARTLRLGLQRRQQARFERFGLRPVEASLRLPPQVAKCNRIFRVVVQHQMPQLVGPRRISEGLLGRSQCLECERIGRGSLQRLNEGFTRCFEPIQAQQRMPELPPKRRGCTRRTTGPLKLQQRAHRLTACGQRFGDPPLYRRGNRRL